MQITGTLKVIGNFYYLITSDNKKYLIISDIVKQHNLTKINEGSRYTAELNNERITKIY